MSRGDTNPTLSTDDTATQVDLPSLADEWLPARTDRQAVYQLDADYDDSKDAPSVVAGLLDAQDSDELDAHTELSAAELEDMADRLLEQAGTANGTITNLANALRVRGEAAHKLIGVMRDNGTYDAAWDTAPLRTYDEIHFVPSRELDLDPIVDGLRDHLASVAKPSRKTKSPTSTPSRSAVDVEAYMVETTVHVSFPSGAKEQAQDWLRTYLTDLQVTTTGIRTAEGRRRRDLQMLNEDFLSTLCVAMTHVAHSYLMSKVRSQFLQAIPEHAERISWVNTQVMDALASYDAGKGLVLEPYVMGLLRTRLPAVDRAVKGRRLSDATNKLSRALNACDMAGKAPTVENLAEAAGMDTDAFYRMMVEAHEADALTNPTSLTALSDTPSGITWEPAALETVEPSLLEREAESELWRHTVKGCLDDKDEQSRAGRGNGYQALLVTYLTYFDNWTKSDLAKAAGVSSNTLNGRLSAAHARIEKRLREDDDI